MKIILPFFLIISFVSFGQDIDNQIIDFFKKKENQLFVNTHGYYFIDVPNEKSYNNRVSGSLSNIDTSNIDFKNLDVQFDYDHGGYNLFSLNLHVGRLHIVQLDTIRPPTFGSRIATW